MPRVRLTGLFLFTTAIFLGLAAAATRTSHIRFNKPDSLVPDEARQPGARADGQAAEATDGLSKPVQFFSVPMIYPLSAVGLVGLLLWFIPGAPLFNAEEGVGRSRGNARRRASRRSSKVSRFQIFTRSRRSSRRGSNRRR